MSGVLDIQRTNSVMMSMSRKVTFSSISIDRSTIIQYNDMSPHLEYEFRPFSLHSLKNLFRFGS